MSKFKIQLSKVTRIFAPTTAIVIAALFIFVVPNTAHAGPVWEGIKVAFSGPISIANAVIGSVLNLAVDIIGFVIIGLGGVLVNIAFSFQHFVEMPIVQIGWTVTRDLANMLFILIMLAVAFSTILQFQTYGFKKIIPKLVIVALTVNFSLLVCGIIIDFGNSITHFFIDSSTPGGEVGTGIMKAIGAGAIAQIRNATSNGNRMIASIFMQLIFYIIMGWALFALAVVMLGRILQLWILIIMCPAAWVGSIIRPNEFKKWWSKFINLAVIMPIIMSFFIFLSFIFASTFKTTAGMLEGNMGTAEEVVSWLVPGFSFSVILQFLAVISFLMVGIHSANKYGASGGEMVVKWTGQGKNWAMGQMKGAGKATGKFAASTPDRLTEGKVSRKLMQGREWLEKQPLIGNVVGGPGKAYKDQQAAIAKEAQNYKGLRPKDIEDRLKQRGFLTPLQIAGLSKALIDKGQFSIDQPGKEGFGPDKNGNEGWVKILQTMQNAGTNIMDLLKIRPDLLENQKIRDLIHKDPNTPKPLRDRLRTAEQVIESIPPVDPAKAKERDEKVAETRTRIDYLERNGKTEEDEGEKRFLERELEILLKEEQRESAGIDELRGIVKEFVLKSPGDLSRVQKEAFDAKGKILDSDQEKEYDRIQNEKEQKTHDIEAYRTRMEDLQKEIDRLKRNGKENEAKPLVKKLEEMQDKETGMIAKYMQEIQNLERQQLNISKQFGQNMMLGFVTSQLMKRGSMSINNLLSLRSGSFDAYSNIMKYLRTYAPGTPGLQPEVGRHVNASIFGQVMVEQGGQSQSSSSAEPTPAGNPPK